MTIEQELALVETVLAPERLSGIQELVFRQCWTGQTYQEMAEMSGYDADYLRVIGSRLWQALSEKLGERITKNNIRSVLRQHCYNAAKTEHSLALHSLQDTAQPLSSDFPGSSLSLDSLFYVMRPPTEENACAEVLRPGALIRIRAPEKRGKTSLMKRILFHAKAHDYQIVHLNFQQADGAVLSNLDRFLRWFCANLTQQLQLESRLDEYWDEDLGSNVSCTTYLQGYVLAQIKQPIAIAMDDVQRLFEYPAIAQDFLPLLRVWHEEAKNLAHWAKLRLIVVYSTEVYIPLQLHQSPFNVGLPIRLPKLTLAQTQEFAKRHGFDWVHDERGIQNLIQLRAMVDGHPYLLHLAFYCIGRGDLMIEQLLEDAPKQNGIYSSHLRNYLSILQAHPELARAFRQVIMAEEAIELEAIAAYKLESMGLVCFYGDLVAPSCDLYRLYFRDRLDQL